MKGNSEDGKRREDQVRVLPLCVAFPTAIEGRPCPVGASLDLVEIASKEDATVRTGKTRRDQGWGSHV